MKIEVCVPNGAQYEAAVAAFAGDSSFAVVRASLTCGSYACIATAGDSFGGMSGGIDGAVNTHLSSFTPYELVQRHVRHAILEEHGGELPVGCSVVVTTQHPKHRVLIYAPIVRVRLPLHAALREDSIAPYLAFRAVLLRAAALVRRRDVQGVSVPLFGAGAGELSVERVCAQMMHANASLVRVPAFMRGDGADLLTEVARDHRDLVASCSRSYALQDVGDSDSEEPCVQRRG